MKTAKGISKEINSGTVPGDWDTAGPSAQQDLYTSQFTSAIMDNLLAACVATRFKYKTIDEVVNSEYTWSIQNDTKTSSELFQLIAFDKLMRNECLTSLLSEELMLDDKLKSDLDNRLHEIHLEFKDRLHNKDIFSCLNKYIDDYSKKKLGNVQTPHELSLEIVDQIPVKLGTSSETVLDPCGGVGTFIFVDKIKNPNNKHFYNDIDLVKCYISNGILNTDTDSSVKIYCSDFLEDFCSMPNIPPKFDVIVGNPPFRSGQGKASMPIYHEFITKSFNSLNDGGHLAMISPPGFLNTTNTEKRREIFDLLMTGNLKVIELDLSNHFPGIGTPTCYVVCEKNAYGNQTIINGETFDLSGKIFVPRIFNSTIESILQKLLAGPDKLNTIYRSDHSLSNFKVGFKELNHISPKKGNIKPHIVLADDENKKYDFVRIVNNEIESENLCAYLKSNVVSFFNYITRYNSVIHNGVIKNLTIPNDLMRGWSEQEIYKYFDLSLEEIKLIENTII